MKMILYFYQYLLAITVESNFKFHTLFFPLAEKWGATQMSYFQVILVILTLANIRRLAIWYKLLIWVQEVAPWMS
jgi:hypothetical protein